MISNSEPAREIARVRFTGLRATAIYSDELTGLMARGSSIVTRASHVEPATSFGWDADGWLADMRPVKGPLLYAGEVNGVKQPFPTRAEALQAERDYLRAKLGI